MHMILKFRKFWDLCLKFFVACNMAAYFPNAGSEIFCKRLSDTCENLPFIWNQNRNQNDSQSGRNAVLLASISILYCNSLSHFKVTWVLTSSEFGYCIKGGQNTAWVSLRLIENLGITRNRTDTFSMTSFSEKNRNYEISTMPKRDSLR